MSVRLMARIWELQLPPSHLLVALALGDHGDDDGNRIFPSLALVAFKTGYSARQVRRIIRELEAGGLLVKVADACSHRPTEYRMDTAAVPAKPAFTRADNMSARQGESSRRREGPTADEMSGRGRTSATSRADIAMSAEPSLEPSGEPPHTSLRWRTNRSSGVVVEGDGQGDLAKIGFAFTPLGGLARIEDEEDERWLAIDGAAA
jgi:hypothetical protein